MFGQMPGRFRSNCACPAEAGTPHLDLAGRVTPVVVSPSLHPWPSFSVVSAGIGVVVGADAIYVA